LTLGLANGIPSIVISQFPITAADDLSARNPAAPPATPYLRIHQPTLFRNLDRLADYAKVHGIDLRPHAKTHKSLQIARWQLERGAVGITAAKPSEAEVLADACDDILLAYPVVDAQRAEHVVRLSRRVEIKVAVDSAHAVATLSRAATDGGATVGVLVDLDVGLHRTGVQSAEAALTLAQAVERSPGVELRGLFCYPGHIWKPAEAQTPELQAVAEKLDATLDAWRRHGCSAEIVSGGSTPTAYQSHLIDSLTEIRPGTYPFNDMNTVRGGYATVDQCAATIVATVVSDAVPGQVVIDAGSKTLAADRCVTHPDAGHGHVLEYPEARVTKLSEEHAQVDVTPCGGRPRIGERLTIIPNHICPCVNLQDRVWLEGPDGDLTPLAVDARGRLT
jgi:D-serine deaminase-like pyridoxal phosphate-dependent protein